MPQPKSIVLISLNDYLALGVRNISASLQQNGFGAKVIFFKNMISNPRLSVEALEEELLLDLVRQEAPALVGISVCTPYLKTATRVTRRIQRELDIPVVWGGVHPTIMPEQSIAIADIICIGEGEQPMLKLMQNKAGEGIAGIWRRQNGKILKNSELLPIQDLNALPYSDYSDAGKYFIEANQVYAGDPALYQAPGRVGSWRKGLISLKNEYYLLASRGCPFHCGYCCNSYLHQKYSEPGRVVRWRNVDNVIGELREITKRFPKIRKIQFYDALFPWEGEWVAEFCQKYKQHIQRPFYVSTHPNLLKEDKLMMLKDAGVEIVGFGIESGAERVRREIYDREVADTAIINAAKLIHKHKIEPHFYIILDNPFESDKDKAAGLELLLALPRPFVLIIHALYLFPKVAVTKKVLTLRFGELSQAQIDDWLIKQSELDMDFTSHPIKDVFWKSLYALTAKRFVPKPLIRFLSKNKFLQKHPQTVFALAIIADYIKFMATGLMRLCKGQISLKNVRNNLTLSQFVNTYH